MSETVKKNDEGKIIVRPIRIEDYDQLVALQLKCFPGMKPWRKEQIESQLRIFPEGQLCVDYEGKIVASSSSLIIDFDIYGEWHNWREIAAEGYITNHNPQGDTLYGIEIMVDPEFRGMKLARRLYEARKELAIKYNLMRIVLGGRIPGYAEYQDKMSAREYVERVKRKELHDPVLTTQLSNGFVLRRLIKAYMESDKESAGYATLLEWPNLDYQPDPTKRYLAVKPVRVCVVQYQMRDINSFKDFSKDTEYFVDVASDYKSDFVLFPELITMQLLSYEEPLRPGLAVRRLAEYTPQYIEHFSKLAIKYNINIIGGSTFTIENDRLYNMAYLFHRSGKVDKQPKLHITPNERHWWGIKGGNAIEVFTTDRGKICIQICHDVSFPELTRAAVSKGAQFLFVPFNTDERYGYLRVRYCAQARAIENHIYVAVAGTVGNLPSVQNMDIQYAQSAIFTPSDIPFQRDAISSECTPNVEMVIVEDLDLELLKRNRQSGSVVNWHDRRQELYK